MKIFSLRNMVGLAAIYGAAQYAKKHGGVRNALTGLVDKVRGVADVQRSDVIGKAHDASVGPSYGTGRYEGTGASRGDSGSNRRG